MANRCADRASSHICLLPSPDGVLPDTFSILCKSQGCKARQSLSLPNNKLRAANSFPVVPQWSRTKVRYIMDVPVDS